MMSEDDEIEKKKEAAVLKLRDYLRSKGLDARMEVHYGFTTNFVLDVYDVTMEQWRSIKRDEVIINAIKFGILKYVAGYTRGWNKKGSVLKHLHVFSSENLHLEIPPEVAGLRDHFKAKGFHVQAQMGYDIYDRPFYALAFYGLTHKQHEALEKDPELNAALGSIIASVAFFEKGWRKDITKISVDTSVPPSPVSASGSVPPDDADDSFDPEEIRQIMQSLEDIKKGRYKDYTDVEDLIRDLHSDSNSDSDEDKEPDKRTKEGRNENARFPVGFVVGFFGGLLLFWRPLFPFGDCPGLFW